MAYFCPKVYWNGIEQWAYKGLDTGGQAGSISYSTPHKLSNATGYTGTPYNLGCYSGWYSNIPSTRTIRIGYNYNNRKLKFWYSTTITPGSGSSAPTCTEITPVSETWDDELGWVYEVVWPSDKNAFIITEDDKYEKYYSYQNVHREGITFQEFYSRWDYAYTPNGDSRIMYKPSGAWSKTSKYIRRWDGSSWKTS